MSPKLPYVGSLMPAVVTLRVVIALKIWDPVRGHYWLLSFLLCFLFNIRSFFLYLSLPPSTLLHPPLSLTHTLLLLPTMRYLEKSWSQHHAFGSPNPTSLLYEVPSLVYLTLVMENKLHSYYEELEKSGLNHAIFQRTQPNPSHHSFGS